MRDIDARRARHAARVAAEPFERLDRGLFDPEHQFLDEDAEASQVEQGICDDLARAVVRDLAAAIGGDHRDVGRFEQVLAPTGLAERGCSTSQSSSSVSGVRCCVNARMASQVGMYSARASMRTIIAATARS
jgi:hypothetical protein